MILFMKKSQMMKGFKFWLIWLLVWLFWLTCFSNAWSYIYSGTSTSTNYTSSSAISFPIRLTKSPSGVIFTLDCTFNWLWSSLSVDVYWHWINSSKDYWEYKIWTLSSNWWNLTVNPNSANFLTIDSIDFRVKQSSTFTYSCFISWARILWDCPICEECQECSEVDTWAILSWSCDTNYCVQNDLCPVSSWWRSELVINDIVHQSAPLININIPEEYSWDYTVDDNEFALDISWQNVDYEYIDWVIRTQKFTPNENDFNSIITWLVPLLIPWLVIILFIWFIFRFIKKIF